MPKKRLKEVSLITTVLNEADNIKEFMDSILNQTVLPREFIIVDGGSTDGTYEVLEKYAKKYKWIKIYQAKGASIGKGRNIAIEKAKGKIIAVTDAGCIVDKKWLEEITKPFFKKKNIDVVVGIYKPYYTNDFEYFQGLLIVKEPEKIFGSPSRMSSRSIAFRRECWEKVDGYPDHKTGEDTLFNIRLLKKGCNFSFAKNAIVYWRMRKNLKSLFKQFYNYGKGDALTGNIWKMKKKFMMVIGFFIWLATSLMLLLYNITNLFTFVFILPFIYLIFISTKSFTKTKKFSSFIWVPIIETTKRLGYIFGIIAGLRK